MGQRWLGPGRPYSALGWGPATSLDPRQEPAIRTPSPPGRQSPESRVHSETPTLGIGEGGRATEDSGTVRSATRGTSNRVDAVLPGSAGSTQVRTDHGS